MANRHDRPIEDEDFYLPGLICPLCGLPADGQSPVDGGRAPIVGDVSLCLYCCQPARFIADDNGKILLRELTDEEWAELSTEMLQEMALAQRLVRAAHQDARKMQ